MEEYMGYRIISIQGNPRIDTEIAEAVRKGFLWIFAVPRVGPFLVAPFPTHLILGSTTFDNHDAQVIYEAWVNESYKSMTTNVS